MTNGSVVNIIALLNTPCPRWLRPHVRQRRQLICAQGSWGTAIEAKITAARFSPAGGLELKVTGEEFFQLAFRPGRVLEIRNLENERLQSSPILCPVCYHLFGRMREVVSRSAAEYRCEHPYLKRVPPAVWIHVLSNGPPR